VLGELPEIWGFPFNITATAKASDFKFATQLGRAKAHDKITPRWKSHGCLRLGELPKIFGFPYNISASAGDSDFKFGAQLGFAKAHYKITRRRKDEHGPGLGERPKIWGFPFNIYIMAEAIDFKVGTQLWFAKAHHKSTSIGKSWHGLGLGELPNFCCSTSIFTQRLKLETSNLVHSLDLTRPTIKPHAEEKWAWPCVRKAPINLGFPFNIFATAARSF